MSLLKLKSIFSPTNTKFQDNQTNLSTFPTQFDNDFRQTNLLKLDSLYDNGLNIQIKPNLLNLNSKFDNGLNNPILSNLLDSSFNTIFDDGISSKFELYTENQPQDSGDTKFDYNESSLIGQTYGFGVEINSPTLDSLLRGRVYSKTQYSQNFTTNRQFVDDINDSTGNHPFLNDSFDPRSNLEGLIKDGTIYQNTNNSFRQPSQSPEVTFGTAGIQSPYSGGDIFNSIHGGNYGGGGVDLESLGVSFYNGENNDKNLSWESLYNSNHTPKDNPKWQGGNLEALNYGSIVNRDNLKIGKRDYVIGERYGFDRGDEPYVVSPIGNEGRELNKGGRSLPMVRALTDGDRILNFITSNEGIAFALRQNINIPIQNTVINKNGSLVRTPQRFGVTYNPLSSLVAASARALGQSVPNILTRKSGFDLGADILGGIGSAIGGKFGDTLNTVADLLSPTEYKHSPANAFANKGQPNGLPTFSVNDTFTGGLIDPNLQSAAQTLSEKMASGFKNLINGETAVTPVSAGDKMTLANMIKGESLVSAAGKTTANKKVGNALVSDPTTLTFMDVEAEENGMPFYFKDLRDNSYIFFRAYLDGISENISPSWNSQNYIGRSEPVYIYERAEREIQFTLKLAAQTKDELVKIYKKMDRLTSLCYPEYVDDEYGNRMKPPLTKFRMGEMFGYENNELMGFIKSISYSIDQTSTWETDVGKRVPRHVTVSIGYQVIHGEVPNMKTKFYGINK